MLTADDPVRYAVLLALLVSVVAVCAWRIRERRRLERGRRLVEAYREAARIANGDMRRLVMQRREEVPRQARDPE